MRIPFRPHRVKTQFMAFSAWRKKGISINCVSLNILNSAPSLKLFIPLSAMVLASLVYFLVEPEGWTQGQRLRYWVTRTKYRPMIVIDSHSNNGFKERVQAFRTLSKLGEPAVPALIAMLSDPDAPTRWQAAMALGRIGPTAKPAVTGLLLLLNATNETVNVRQSAGWSLGLIHDKPDAVIPALMNIALVNEIEEIRAGATLGLVEFGSESVPYIVRALDSSNSLIRARAAAVAPACRSTLPVARLRQLLLDEDIGVRKASTNALFNLGVPLRTDRTVLKQQK